MKWPAAPRGFGISAAWADADCPLRCSLLLLQGADELTGGGRVRRRHSQFPVDEVKDTNGAGDCFATAYALSDLAGRGVPGAVGNWGGAMAVTQPQSCKPGCIVDAVQQRWESMPRGRAAWGLRGLVAQIARHLTAGPPGTKQGLL